MVSSFDPETEALGVINVPTADLADLVVVFERFEADCTT
jgi:hypothetical protein